MTTQFDAPPSPPPIRRIRVGVDVDGPLADLAMQISRDLREHYAQRGRPDRGAADPWHHSRWLEPRIVDSVKLADDERDAVRALMNAPGFAARLPVDSIGVELMDLLRGQDVEIIAVTSTKRSSPTWTYDRLNWLKTNFGIGADRVVFAKRKDLVEVDLLIDDLPQNILTWMTAHPARIGLLWPTFGNRGWRRLHALQSHLNMAFVADRTTDDMPYAEADRVLARQQIAMFADVRDAIATLRRRQGSRRANITEAVQAGHEARAARDAAIAERDKAVAELAAARDAAIAASEESARLRDRAWQEKVDVANRLGTIAVGALSAQGVTVAIDDAVTALARRYTKAMDKARDAIHERDGALRERDDALKLRDAAWQAKVTAENKLRELQHDHGEQRRRQVLKSVSGERLEREMRIADEALAKHGFHVPFDDAVVTLATMFDKAIAERDQLHVLAHNSATSNHALAKDLLAAQSQQATLRRERDEARVRNTELIGKFNLVVAALGGEAASCMWCGEGFTSRDDAQAHVATCAKHPAVIRLREVEAQAAKGTVATTVWVKMPETAFVAPAGEAGPEGAPAAAEAGPAPTSEG